VTFQRGRSRKRKKKESFGREGARWTSWAQRGNGEGEGGRPFLLSEEKKGWFNSFLLEYGRRIKERGKKNVRAAGSTQRRTQISVVRREKKVGVT